MKPGPFEVKTCDKCQSFVPPQRQGWRSRCHLTGRPVCRKAKGCYFYKLVSHYSPGFRPGPQPRQP